MQEKHKYQLGSHFSSDITYEYSHDLDTELHKFWIMWDFRSYLNRKSNRIEQNDILYKTDS
jgi:hypothetical protein